MDNTLKVWDTESGDCRATHPLDSVDAQVVWGSVGRLDESRRLSTEGGRLQLALRLLPKAQRTDTTYTVPENFFAPGSFDQAYGPLAGDTILAFTDNGKAHWFCIRRRDGA